MNNDEMLKLILEKIGSLESGQQEMRTEMNGMRSEITGMRSEMNGMRSEMNDMRSEMNSMRADIEDLKEGQKAIRRDVARMTIATMIYDLGNTIYQIMNRDNRKKNRAETIFTDFIALIEKNFRTERRVSWYGRQLCITPKYLSECIKQVSQRTPNEWIDNYVVMELRVQIKNSRKSIKQIAMDMNFPSQSFMGKYFKEHVGMSPTEYRRS